MAAMVMPPLQVRASARKVVHVSPASPARNAVKAWFVNHPNLEKGQANVLPRAQVCVAQMHALLLVCFFVGICALDEQRLHPYPSFLVQYVVIRYLDQY
jgi:hypothetical protein